MIVLVLIKSYQIETKKISAGQQSAARNQI